MKLVWSEAAYNDRTVIFDFIAADRRSAALRVDARIQEQAERLVAFPELGREGRVENTRELPVKGFPYVIVYSVRRQHVRVLRILHGAQQWPAE